MICPIIFLTVLYILEGEANPIEAIKTDNSSGNSSPLTGHLLKFLNHFDDSIIGFHLVVPRDDYIVNNYVEKPSQVSKILEYVTQINYLRNMIENDPEVSLKRKNDRGLHSKNFISTPNNIANSGDPHHTDILIFSQISHQQRPDARNASKKLDGGESVIFVPYPKSEEQNVTDIYSKTVGHKNNAYLDSKNSWRGNKMGNLSFFKAFEDGMRVYPLISVSQRNDSIDCFTGKVNCSQQEICFLGRSVRSKPDSDSDPEKCAFLVQSCHSKNPSLLFVPKSMDTRAKLFKKNVEESNLNKESIPERNRVTVDEAGQVSPDDGNESPRRMTFLAPLSESALVLPIKPDELSALKTQTDNHFLKKRDTLFSNSENNGFENNNFEQSYKFNKYKKSYNNVSRDEEVFNETAINNYYDSISFADILRQSITDLVNGADPNSQPYGSVYDNDDIRSSSNVTSSDYNLYFLFDPDRDHPDASFEGNPAVFTNYSDSNNVLYSSPKSKVNKASFMGLDSNNFVGLSDYWPFIMSQRKNKSDLDKQRETFFSSNFDDSYGNNELNSFYRDKIVHILSHAKKGQCGTNSTKRKREWDRNFRKGKLATIDSGNKFLIKYVPKNFEMSQDGVGQRNNWTFNRIKRSDSGIEDLGTSNMTSYAYPSNVSSFEEPTVDFSSLKHNLEESYGDDIFISSLKNLSRKAKAIGRINRSLGEIMLIPQMDRNFGLLIVYPYQRHNKKLKTIVSKSVKKTTGRLSDKKYKSIPSLPSSFSSNDNVLQTLMSVQRGPDFKVQLDKSHLKELSKKKGKMEPASKAEAKHIRRPEDVLKPVSYYERDDADFDQRKYYHIPPNTYLSLRSSLANFVDPSPQNLTGSLESGMKFPVNISDLQAVKLLQSVTPMPRFQSLRANFSESFKGSKDLNLLRNLTTFNTLDVIKKLHLDPSPEDGTKLNSSTENLNLVDTSKTDPLNSTNLRPFHSSNGFRVSNATNLLIKLTEFKSPKETNRFKSAEAVEPIVTAPSESPVTSKSLFLQILSESPLLNKKRLNSTDRSFGPFFKSSKTFTSALVSNDAKVLNNSSQAIEFTCESISQSSPNPLELQVPRTSNEMDMVQANSTDTRHTCAPNFYCLTERCGRENATCFALKNSTSTLGREFPIVRSTKASVSVTSMYEEDDEACEEPEDADDGCLYPDFAPVISVNIFPILGGWRKPQIKATSLIKELFRKSQRKEEEEELPTYLSELFDEAELNRTQSKLGKTTDHTQRKLDDILTGHSINDILKLKVHNILQLSTNSTKGNVKSDKPIDGN